MQNSRFIYLIIKENIIRKKVARACIYNDDDTTPQRAEDFYNIIIHCYSYDYNNNNNRRTSLTIDLAAEIITRLNKPDFKEKRTRDDIEKQQLISYHYYNIL